MKYFKFFTLQLMLCAASISVQFFSYDLIEKGFNLPAFLIISLNISLVLIISWVFQKFNHISFVKKTVLLIIALLVAAIIIGLVTGEIQFG